MERAWGRAIVIGGSMGGLLAARVLAEHFEQVIVLERDELPAAPEPRSGVPQGRHVHALLHAGQEVLEELFPGILAELRRGGANLIDSSRDLAWHHFGVWKARADSGVGMLLATRPFLEWHVRRRLGEIANVDYRQRHVVEELLTDRARRRITGVRLTDGSELRAELVVDAAGRGSQTPQRLLLMGYAQPDEERLGIDLSYTTRLYEPPAGARADWKFLVEYPRSPDGLRGGFISCVEKDRWVVSLNGYFNDEAPTDERGFLEFARALPRPDIYELIKDAKPLSDIVMHRIPTTRWRRYDRLARFPENLVLIGDAVCAFNPIFGQGITVASLQARLLGQCLAEQARTCGQLAGLADRVRRRQPEVIELPWFLTKTLDLHYPQTRGQQPFGHSLLMWYVTRLLELTSTSPRVFHELLWTLHLKRGLWNLLKPATSARVLLYAARSLFVPLAKRANTDQLPAPQALAS